VRSGGSLAGGRGSAFSASPSSRGAGAAASVGAGDGNGGRDAPHGCQVPPSFPSISNPADSIGQG